jgi:DNA invertase Pin-like site-specific DNA recombinase
MAMFSGSLPQPGSRALLLGRYSDNLQNPLSADDQIDALREDCAKFGWDVVGVFTDKGKSGRSAANRPGYLDMMAVAEAGGADVICVFQLDRLGRNARELHDANGRLQDVKCAIYTHDKGVMGRLEFAIYAEMSHAESERIAERTTRGRLAAATRGKFMGCAPYGYRLVDEKDDKGQPLLNSRGNHVRRIEVDPVTSKVVLRANLDFDAGKSPHQIAISLTAEGVPTPRGGKIWHPNTIIGVNRSISGLLRNPIFIGRYIHGKAKTTYDERSGRVTRHKAPIADQIEHDMPWLRIVPQDVWDRNQERLSERPPSKLRDRRRPTYLLSGLVKCGVCGGAFVMVAAKMGCSARHLKACTNERRVKRQDLERVVLEGLTQRLAQPPVISWFIPEYLRERGPATSDAAVRHERAVKRLAEIDREVGNLIMQIKGGAGDHASKLINDNLENLGAEKERLARQVRAGPPAVPEALTADNLVPRIHALLGDLGQALNGSERDATRARDVLRSLITEVTITPFDAEGSRPDRRGAGSVRVQVEGEVSRLVDRAMLDRKIMHSRGASDVHDLPIATFQFYIDLAPTRSPEQEGAWRDTGVIGRLLDDADWPVTFREMIAALDERDREATALEAEIDENRARIALAQFRRDNWVRSVRLDGTDRGWVWSGRDISDAQWLARYHHRRRVVAMLKGQGRAEGAIGIVRLSAPEAHVVTIGPREDG